MVARLRELGDHLAVCMLTPVPHPCFQELRGAVTPHLVTPTHPHFPVQLAA